MGTHSEFRHTAATKAKLSDMRRGDRNPFYGRTHSPEWKAALSARMQGNPGNIRLAPTTVRVLERSDAAYLAGIIDGEGSVATHRARPSVIVYNTSRPLIEWLESRVGGTSRVQHTVGRSPCYAWSVCSARNVASVLRAVLPFLVIKAERAQAALDSLTKKYGDQLNG